MLKTGFLLRFPTFIVIYRFETIIINDYFHKNVFSCVFYKTPPKRKSIPHTVSPKTTIVTSFI